MELLEITLNISSFEAIGSVILLVTGLFGAPYLVRAENKKKLDAKADLIMVEDLKKDIEKKASYVHVAKEVDEVRQDFRDHTKSNDTQFESLRAELSVINTNILNVLKEVKRS